ncbi:MAG: phosphotransferase [Candidatus Hodarchaeales archaeon]|jgi:aminoglycoside phosphotransferase family enzyme
MDIVDLLSHSESYPHPTGSIELRETHISWVFLTDELVYKVKKPVTLFDGILDYSTLPLRKKYCDLEIQLNRKLCPDIYLSTASITAQGIEDNPTTEIIDYAVKMRRMPEEGLLRRKLEQGEPVSTETMKHMARLIADYHALCEEKPEYGAMDKLRRKIEENFETANQRRSIDNDYIQRVRDFMSANESLFSQRIHDRRVRRCHGDLQPNNIILDGENVYIFDCVEFTELFCSGDVAEDVGFLAMDLDYWGQTALAGALVDEYVRASGDKGLLTVLNFFKSYRAFVRGKVHDIMAAGVTKKAERENQQELARKYFELAYSYL